MPGQTICDCDCDCEIDIVAPLTYRSHMCMCLKPKTAGRIRKALILSKHRKAQMRARARCPAQASGRAMRATWLSLTRLLEHVPLAVPLMGTISRIFDHPAEVWAHSSFFPSVSVQAIILQGHWLYVGAVSS